MSRLKLFPILLLIVALQAASTKAATDADSNANKNKGGLIVNVTSLEISEKDLKLHYEIRNDSEDDVWILAGWGKYGKRFRPAMAFGMSIAEDGSTLMISSRFNVPKKSAGSKESSIVPIYARFVRLYPGESRTESFIASIPLYISPYTEYTKREDQDLQYATRLSIQLGYYSGNILERIFKKLKPPENVFPKVPANYPVSPDTFSMWNELLTSRDEELLIPEVFHEIKGENERISRTAVENLSIPYKKDIYYPSKFDPPDLTSCIKVELHYKPSMLEYFFPYTSQQSILSPEEMSYLRSDKAFFTKDKQKIKIIANDVIRTETAHTVIGGINVRSRSHVDVVCHYDDKPSLSFPIYDDHVALIEGVKFWGTEGFSSLKILTPQIQSIDLRMRCAANLKNLWYRFRFYNQGEALCRNDLSIRSQTLYPTPAVWCDDILRPYPALGGFATVRRNVELNICPSAGKGKNHYAMNPNCKPNSTDDMVLLFETKAGWNQHGGPELFTFDNHDPKGGCVLLNDGTVKFIRTKEELQQLRWK